jgi:preprotein translocase subunit YajC
MSFINKAYAEEVVTTPVVEVVNVEQPNPLVSLLPMVLIFVVFYFFMIRPQNKKQQTHEKMISGLKKGDNVVAAGGIFGKIIDTEDQVLVLQVSNDVNIKVLRSSVINLLDKKGEIVTEEKLLTKETSESDADNSKKDIRKKPLKNKAEKAKK